MSVTGLQVEIKDGMSEVYVMGTVLGHMRRAGISEECRKRYLKDAQEAKTYEGIIEVTKEYVDLCVL